MKPIISIVIPLVTFVAMATVGSDLCLVEFRSVMRQPRVVLAGLLMPLVVLPPLAVGLIAIYTPPVTVATGLLLVAACPIGGISNIYSYLARASTALSVSLTGLSCLLAAVTIPAISLGFEWVYHQPLGLNAPLPLLGAQLLVMLMLPVSLGMWTRHRWPQFADAYATSMQRGALASLGLLLLMVILGDPSRFLQELPSTVPLAATFAVTSFAAGWVVGLGVGAGGRDRLTLAIEFATRHVAVATALAVTLVGRLEFATFATTYFLTELLLMTPGLIAFRRAHASAA